MTKLARSVDEFEGSRGLFEGRSSGWWGEGLSESEDTLLGTDDATLEDEEVVVDDTIVRESTHGVDGLLGNVRVSRSRSVRRSVSDSVDLLVELSSVVVSVLTSSRDSVSDVGRVPGTNTGNLSETSMGLSRQLLGSPSSSNTFVTVTLGDTNDIDGLIWGEDGGSVDGLLEVALGKVDLVSDGTTIDLDLHEVSLLLLETSLSDLGVGQDSDDGAVLPDSLEFSGNALTAVLRVLLGVLGKGLLLGSVPVLVESPLDFIGQVLGPDGGQGSETSRSLDVSNDTDDDHRRGLDDGDSLYDFSLVHLGTRLVEVSDDVGHTSLVSHDGSEVDGLLGVVLGEGLDLTAVSGSTLSGEETQRTMSVKRRSIQGSVVFALLRSQILPVENEQSDSLKPSTAVQYCLDAHRGCSNLQ